MERILSVVGSQMHCYMVKEMRFVLLGELSPIKLRSKVHCRLLVEDITLLISG